MVPSEEGLSTPSVYRRFDELNPDVPAEPEDERALLLALATGDPVLLAGALHNDLESAALDLRPDLADLLELGERSGALRGLVSGSGPTCLFLTEDADSAREVAARLSESHGVVLVTNGPDVWRQNVGIVGDIKQNGVDKETTSQTYEPNAQ